jgi:hypothetical protein
MRFGLSGVVPSAASPHFGDIAGAGESFLGEPAGGLLRRFAVHPPFVFQQVSGAPNAFVVENHRTYDSACSVLKTDQRDVGVLVYGAGRAFCGSVTYLADLELVTPGPPR